MQQITGVSLLVSRYKDKDAVINVITKDGIVSFLGRGIYNFKNKNFVFSNPYILANFELYKGPVGGDKLKDASIIKNYNDSKQNFLTLSTLDFLSELILKTQEGLENNQYNEVYFNLINVLDSLKDGDTKIKMNLCEFVIKLTKLLGVGITNSLSNKNELDLNSCLNIKNIGSSFKFSEEEVGFIRDMYRDKHDFTYENINFLRIIYIFSLYLEQHFDIKINSKDIISIM